MRNALLWMAVLFAAHAFNPSLDAAVILSQDFESGSPPSGWSLTQNTPSVGWEFGTNLGSSYFQIPSHTRYAASNDDAHDNSSTTANLADRDRLISPAMNLSFYSGQGVLLTFAYVQPSTYGSTGSVEVSTDGGATWVELVQVAPSSTWATFNVSLTSYTSFPSVKIAFRHNDHGNWADGFAVDDVVIQSLPSRDLAMEELVLPSYIAQGTVAIQATVANMGGDLVSSIDFTYAIDSGPAVAGSVSGLNLSTGDSTVVTHPVPHDFSTAGTSTIDLHVTAVNGQVDLNAANDNASGTVHVLSTIPAKFVILEQHTGAWCQFCPDGTVVFDQARALGGVIGVSVHNSDAMETVDGTTVQSTYITGYPGGTIDRVRFDGANGVEVGRGQWLDRINQRLQDIVPAEVLLESVSYDSGTRELSATVRANFFSDMTGDLRLNLWVVEDGVTGSGTGYDQVNYYNTQPGHPYYGAGNPIVGFVHDGVVRAMLGGPWGLGGEIPAAVGDGDSFPYTFVATLAPEVDPNSVRLVGVLQYFDLDENQRQLINATQRHLLLLFGDGFESGTTDRWSATVP